MKGSCPEPKIMTGPKSLGSHAATQARPHQSVQLWQRAVQPTSGCVMSLPMNPWMERKKSQQHQWAPDTEE